MRTIDGRSVRRVRLGAIGVTAIFALSGCREIECGRYFDLTSDDVSRAQLVAWADREIFTKQIDQDAIGLGHLVGPGRRAIKLGRLGVVSPDGLEGDEVRVIAQDRIGVSSFFVGRHSYRGIIVARDEVSSITATLGIPERDVKIEDGRVAVVCFRQR